MKLFPQRMFFSGLIVLGLAVIIAAPAASLGGAPTSGQASAGIQAAAALHGELPAGTALQPETISTVQRSTVPPPEQNPCLHCHVAGEIVNEWSPISRWFVFGTMGFTFIFGMTRNFMVWRTRQLWQHRWMYFFSRATAFVFVVSAISGIVVLLLNQATLGIITQITAVINAIHWGSGIVLLIAALGLSFGGALLPWYQRPLWAMIFITGIVGGALGIANLSFTYLYGEWHDPPAPGHLYGFHILLIPLAIAGILSIFFILQGKRGENR